MNYNWYNEPFAVFKVKDLYFFIVVGSKTSITKSCNELYSQKKGSSDSFGSVQVVFSNERHHRESTDQGRVKLQHLVYFIYISCDSMISEASVSATLIRYRFSGT